MIGSLGLSGTIKDATHYTLTAPVPSAKLGGFALTNGVATLSASGLSFAADASLPIIGAAHLSGAIQDAAHYSLTVGLPSLSVGGFALTKDTATLSASGLSLSGTASLPVIGIEQLSGTITDASHYSLAAPVPSAKLGGFALTNGVATLSAAALAFSADASLPIIGAVHLSGAIQDAAHYSLAVGLPSLSVGGFALTKDTVTLSPTGLSLSGTAQLPLIGSLGLSGTIKDATHYSLTAPVPSAKLSGFALTNGAATLTAIGLAFSADASLPIIGAAHLAGSIQDAAHYSLTASLPTLSVGGFALTKDTATLSASGLSLSGTAQLPVIGSLGLSGTITDANHYSLTASVPSVKLGGFALTNPKVALANGILNLSGTAQLPALGSLGLSGTIKDASHYSLTAPVPSAKLGGFALTNGAATLTATGLAFSADASLPVVGAVHLSGSIQDAAHYSLTVSLPSLNVGGFALTKDTATLSATGLSLSGTAQLPALGSLGLSGTIKDATHYSLTASVPSVKLGGFALTSGVATLSAAGLAFSADASLPVVGAVHLSGAIQDAAHYSLTVGLPSLSVGGFALTKDTATLSPAGLSLSGTASLPAIGTEQLSGTIKDATHYTLTAPVPSAKLGGFALTNGVATLSASGLAFSADANLPVVGAVHLSGSIQDAAHYSLTVSLPSLTVGGFALTKNTVTLAAAGLSLSGTAQLPVIGSLGLSGTITNSTHYSLSAQIPRISLGGFTFSNDTVALANGALTLTGTVTLPVIGSVTLTGTIVNTTHFSLTKSLGNLQFGPFAVTGASVTVGDSGSTVVVSLAGTATFDPFGKANLVGTLGSDGSYSLSAPMGSASLLGGLVKFQSTAVTVSIKGSSVAVGISGHGTVANIGTVNFKGSITGEGDYSLTGDASLNIAGFSIHTAEMTLGTDALGVSFTLPVPEVGDVNFTGSYGPGGQWSLGATYPGPVEVGPVTLTDLGFVLSSQSLTLKATGSIADLQDLANVQVTAQVFYDGRFQIIADAHVLQFGPFSLGEAVVTVGNANPQHQFVIDVHAVAGFPNLGAGMTLDGVLTDSHNYDLKGTDNLAIAGLPAITSVKAELSSATGFTFKGSWNYGVMTATVSGTIQGDGHAHFEGNATLGTSLGGFTPASFDAVVNVDPAHGTYSIDASAKVNALIATLTFQAHASKDAQGWQPLVLTTQATVGGPLSKILSGQANFTVDPSGVSFSGTLTAAGGLASFKVSGEVYANGTLQIGGFLGKAGQMLAQDAAALLEAVGADARLIASELSSLYHSLDTDVASFLHNVGVGAAQIGDALQNVFKDSDQALAAALNYAGVLEEDIAGGLNTLFGKDMLRVASAIWGGIGGSLDDLGGALANGIGGLYSDMAKALSGLPNVSLPNVAHALKVGIGLDLSGVASALHFGPGLDLAAAAQAIWNSGIGGFNSDDLGGALAKGIGGLYSDMAKALSGLSNVSLPNVAHALKVGIGLDLSGVASALHFGPGLDLAAAAQAIWNSGIGGFNSDDLGGALAKGIGGLYSDMAKALSGLSNVSLPNVAHTR